jgi:hypothetical protein
VVEGRTRKRRQLRLPASAARRTSAVFTSRTRPALVSRSCPIAAAHRHRLADLGHDIPPRDQQTPEALGAYHKAEIEKWWPIIKSAGVKAE